MDKSYTIRQPQLIPTTADNKYNLKHGLFNPIQNSPPNVWRSRLIDRVKNGVFEVNPLKK